MSEPAGFRCSCARWSGHSWTLGGCSAAANVGSSVRTASTTSHRRWPRCCAPAWTPVLGGSVGLRHRRGGRWHDRARLAGRIGPGECGVAGLPATPWRRGRAHRRPPRWRGPLPDDAPIANGGRIPGAPWRSSATPARGDGVSVAAAEPTEVGRLAYHARGAGDQADAQTALEILVAAVTDALASKAGEDATRHADGAISAARRLGQAETVNWLQEKRAEALELAGHGDAAITAWREAAEEVVGGRPKPRRGSPLRRPGGRGVGRRAAGDPQAHLDAATAALAGVPVGAEHVALAMTRASASRPWKPEPC